MQTIHILFLAEGLLMYLHEADVKALLLALQHRFPGSELVCEVANTFMVRILQKKRWQKKFKNDYSLGAEATFHFGIENGSELESWGPGITFLDEWTIFDDHEKKLGWMRLFSFSKKLTKAQWLIHYRLQPPDVYYLTLQAHSSFFYPNPPFSFMLTNESLPMMM